MANATCEPLELVRVDSNEVWGTDPAMYPNGTIEHIPYHDMGSEDLNLTLRSASCETIKYQARYRTGTPTTYFDSNIFGSTNRIDKLVDMAECYDNDPRFVVSTTLTNVTYNQVSLPLHLVKSSSIICKASYGIYPATVTINANNSINSAPVINIERHAKPSVFPGISASDLANALYNSYTAQNQGSSIELHDYLTAIRPGVTTEDLMSNSELLADLIQELFARTSAQIANIYLTTPSSRNIPAHSLEMQNRLMARWLAFGSVMCLLACLASFALLLAYKRPYSSVSCDPGSIIGLASILARSPELRDLLHGTGSNTLAVLGQKLSGHCYGVKKHGSFGIVVQPSADSTDDQEYLENPEIPSKLDWYHPFQTSLPGKALILTATMITLCALEGVHQISRAHDGLTDIGHDQYVHYAFTLIPTFHFVVLGMVFGAVDFSVRMFQPYHLLTRKAVPWTAMNSDMLARIGLHSLWSAIRKRQVATACISSCMILAPFLSIVTSGLYFTEAMPRRYDIQLSQASLLSEEQTQLLRADLLSDEQSGDIDRGFTMANLILNDESKEPLFTYDNLVLPEVTFQSSLTKTFSDGFDNPKITARVPALRIRANCTHFSSDMFTNITFDHYPWFGSNFSVSLQAHAPQACGFGDGNDTVNFRIPAANGKYFGQWGEVISVGYDKSRCPTYWALIGHVNNHKVDEVTALYCKPFVESVQTNVTFNAKDFSLNMGSLPDPDDATASYIGGIDIMRVSDMMYIGYSTDVLAERTGDIIQDERGPVDGFFATLLWGKYAVPFEELIGTANVEKLQSSIERIFGQIFAQVVNTVRVTPPSPGTPFFNATLEVSNRLRLKQSTISTRILQALLATMALSVAVTFIVFNTSKILPKNPCSIAAVASMLADADMLSADVIPDGTEYMSHSEMEKSGIFEGYLFSLGWWPGGRFGIDIGKADRENSS